MDISAFYTTAKNLVEKIKVEKPAYVSDKNSAFCLIKAENGKLYSAVSGIKAVNENEITTADAESIAVNAMFAEGVHTAAEIIVISADNFKVLRPAKECLDMLISADAANSKCSVAVSSSEAVAASDVNYDIAYDTQAEAPALGSAADFADGFDFDETNPFFATPADNAQTEVPTIQNQPLYQQNTQQAAQPMYQQGYPQQGQPMYQQQGYPQQGQQPMYQQQGYPQQGQQPMYQQQGYPQQGQQPMYQQQGYPQQGQQSMYQQGYPQQGVQMPYNSADNLSVAANNNASVYTDHSEFVSQYVSGSSSAFKKRLGNMLTSDDASDDYDEDGTDSISKDELMRQAKEKKKLAKMNSKFKG